MEPVFGHANPQRPRTPRAKRDTDAEAARIAKKRRILEGGATAAELKDAKRRLARMHPHLLVARCPNCNRVLQDLPEPAHPGAQVGCCGAKWTEVNMRIQRREGLEAAKALLKEGP